MAGPGHWPGTWWKLALGPGINLPGPGRLIGQPWLMEGWVARSPPRQSHAHLFWKLLVAKQWDVKRKGNPRGMGQTGAQMTGQMFVGFGESGAGHPQPRLTPAWLPGKPTGTYLLGQLPCGGNWPVVPDGSVKSEPYAYMYVSTNRPVPLVHRHRITPPIPPQACCAHVHAPHVRTHMDRCVTTPGTATA